MQKPGIVVQGIPLGATKDRVHKYFEKALAEADQTVDFEVVYPINSRYCQGIENVSLGAQLAVILFGENERGMAAADYLCQIKHGRVQVSRLPPQVFRELTATVRTDLLKLFDRSKDLNRILGQVQERTCVGLKHQEDGTILLTGQFFQIAAAQEMLDKEIKERASALELKRQKETVSNDEEEPNSTKNRHLSVGSINNSNVADTQALGSSPSTSSENDPKEVEEPKHVQPGMEKRLNAVAYQETEVVNVQNDDQASMQDQKHEDETSDVGQYFPDPEPKRSTQQQQLSEQPRVEGGKSVSLQGKDTKYGVAGESEPSTIERKSNSAKQVEDNPRDGSGERTKDENEQRQDERYRNSKAGEQERKHLATREDNYKKEHTQHEDEEEENGSHRKQEHKQQQAEYTRSPYSAKYSADDTKIGRAARNSSSFSSLPYLESGENPTSIATGKESKAKSQQQRGSGGRHNYDNKTVNSFDVRRHPYGLSLDQKTLSDANVYKPLVGDQIVLIYKSNIVEVRVDAVVNASNTSLYNRTGVSRAIVTAAGIVVDQECQRVLQKHPYLKETEVIPTSGGSLWKHVFHAIGPADSYSHFSSNATAKRSLQTTFRNCLQMAEKTQVTSIAIPAIGSGTSKFPESFVANALHAAVVDFCYETQSNGSLKAIHLVDIDDKQTRETNSCFKHSDHLKKFTSLKVIQAGDSDAGQTDTSSFVVNGVRPGASGGSGRSGPSVGGNGATAAGHMTPPDNSSNGARSKTKSFTKEEKGDCAICLESLNKKKTKSLKCGHVFCEKCIDKAMRLKKVCPTCGTICGKLTGNQPKDGRMTHSFYKYQSLAGYEKCGMIVIDYFFRSGIQGEEHPNPGKRYDGTQRTAYLPDNKEGNEVLDLLRQAFDARLTFTIGQSVTSGLTDQVTWNDIHHKTDRRGGSYGYPDSTYLQRVKEELAAKGIK